MVYVLSFTLFTDPPSEKAIPAPTQLERFSGCSSKGPQIHSNPGEVMLCRRVFLHLHPIKEATSVLS